MKVFAILAVFAVAAMAAPAPAPAPVPGLESTPESLAARAALACDRQCAMCYENYCEWYCC